MGMIGGTPNYAHYFHTFFNDELYFLDPHTTQQSINMKKDWNISSYFCKSINHMKYTELDPSISIVFLIKNWRIFHSTNTCYARFCHFCLFSPIDLMYFFW
jgi:cysteine protease ATG4